MKSMSLKWQILLLVLSIATTVIVVLTTLTIDQIESQLDESLERKAVSISAVLANYVGPALERHDSTTIAETSVSAFEDHDIIGIGIYDVDGRQIFQSTTQPHVFPEEDSCNRATILEATHVNERFYVERPILVDGQIVGCLWLVVTEDNMKAQLYLAVWTVVAVAALLFVLSAVVGVLVARRVVQPIKAFEQAAVRISSGDITSAIDLPNLHRDFVPLGKAFTDMQDTLRQAFSDLNKSRDELESRVARRTQELRDELAERKRAEAALGEGRELLRATLESTADGILVVDSNGVATHSNGRFAEMWRIPPELIATRDDNKLIAHVLDQLSEPQAFLAKVRQLYGSRDESVDMLYFKDGRVFERFSCPLVRNDSLAGRVWSFRDITERVRATERLQFTQFSVDHAAEPAFWMQEDARLFYVNEAACRTLGYSRQELLSMTIHDLDPQFPVEAWHVHWAELQQKGSLTFQSTHRRKNGQEYPVEISANYVEFEGKGYNCAFARDITERRRAEQAQAILLKVAETASRTASLEHLLRTVQQQLGTLIDTTNFYVALWDAEKQVYTFPYSQDERDDDFAPSRLEGSLTDYVRRHGTHLFVDEGKHRELMSRGEARMVGQPSAVWMGVPLRTSAGTIGVMVVQNYNDPDVYNQTDIDWLMSIAEPIARVIERAKADERQLRLSEELERAERMKSLGVLAGGVAHDLNNMLGPLVGYPELMLLKLPEDSPIRKQVQRIGSAAKQAADVVQDLLTLARRGRYEMVPTDLNAVIEGYLDTPGFADLAQQRPDVAVTLTLDQTLAQIMGSTPHLTKVVMNLVINAFDAMPDGGSLSITTSQQRLSKLDNGYDNIRAGDYIRMSVKDSGVGIDPALLDKIFEPYYSSKKMGASGSGLGLSVVYGVVKDHKGYYDIKSEVGKGTEFILYFPVSAVVRETRQPTVRDLRGTEKVLIVEDDGSQREMASELLASCGYRVSSVANGHEALEYLARDAADIVVLDMILERDFDGLDTYREILKLRPGQKAIVVSGFSATERVAELQRLGAGQYVRKPFTRQSLATALRTELDRTADSERTQVQTTSARM